MRRSVPGRASGVVTALVLMAAIRVPANAEVEHASPEGFLVENVVTVPVEPAVAWDALTSQVDLWWPNKDHTWWGEESTLSIDPVAGGCFCETAGTRQSQHLMVSHADPPHVLRMLGGLGPLQRMGLDGALEWQLEPADEGTRITLRYQVGGYAPEDLSQLAPVVDRVQGLQLGGLEKHLRDRGSDEGSRERGVEEHGSGGPDS